MSVCRGTGPVPVALLWLACLGVATGGEGFLSRDGPVAPAYTYPYSDDGDDTAAAPEGPWDVYVGEAKPDGGLELPGPFPILGTGPLRYMLVAGPTFRSLRK